MITRGHNVHCEFLSAVLTLQTQPVFIRPSTLKPVQPAKASELGGLNQVTEADGASLLQETGMLASLQPAFYEFLMLESSQHVTEQSARLKVKTGGKHPGCILSALMFFWGKSKGPLMKEH